MKSQQYTLPSARHSRVSVIQSVDMICENYKTNILHRVGVAVRGEQTASASPGLRNIGRPLTIAEKILSLLRCILSSRTA